MLRQHRLHVRRDDLGQCYPRPQPRVRGALNVYRVIAHHPGLLRLGTELAKAIGSAAVFDLIATVGFYSVLGTILMTYDVPIDEKVAKEMAVRSLTNVEGRG